MGCLCVIVAKFCASRILLNRAIYTLDVCIVVFVRPVSQFLLQIGVIVLTMRRLRDVYLSERLINPKEGRRLSVFYIIIYLPIFHKFIFMLCISLYDGVIYVPDQSFP